MNIKAPFTLESALGELASTSRGGFYSGRKISERIHGETQLNLR